MIRTSRLLLYSGLTIAVAYALLATFIPGGGLRWFLHTPAGLTGLPIGLALIAAGAVVGRLERTEVDTAALRSSTLPGARLHDSDIPSPAAIRDHDAAL